MDFVHAEVKHTINDLVLHLVQLTDNFFQYLLLEKVRGVEGMVSMTVLLWS